ncbi:amidohydrolase family protein [Bradyrhizobium manausense]
MTIAATVSAPGVSAPRRRLPPDACDAHSHVFGPLDRFPPVEASHYALPDASPDVHARIRATLGIARGVLVQPAPYADDPSAILDALLQSNGALRGIAVATANAPDEVIASWVAAGIVGLRFTEMRTPGGERYPGTVGFDVLRTLASRMRQHGLHAQLWASAESLAAELPDLVRLGVPLVLDHMACPSLDRGGADPALDRILDVSRSENIWVKLAICRVSKRPPSFADVRTVHDAFIDAAADRCLWGSDWPYVRMSLAPDAGRLLDLFLEWTADATMQQRILVENPARLYGFGGEK